MFEAAKKRMEERKKERVERERQKAIKAKYKAQLKVEKKKRNAELWKKARKIAGKEASGDEVQLIFYDLRDKEKLTN